MPCEFCGKLFSCMNNLRTHLYYHSDPKFICDFPNCDKKFYMRKRLRAHLKVSKSEASISIAIFSNFHVLRPTTDKKTSSASSAKKATSRKTISTDTCFRSTRKCGSFAKFQDVMGISLVANITKNTRWHIIRTWVKMEWKYYYRKLKMQFPFKNFKMYL